MDWVMETAPPFPAHLIGTLMGLARHADKHGRGAYPSVARLAAYGCKAARSVQRDLRELEKLGLIRTGDQSLAEDIPADRRPPVYDLAVDVSAEGGSRVPKGRSASGRASRIAERGDAGVAPFGVTSTSPRNRNGVTSMAERGDTHGRNGVTSTSPKRSVKPSGKELLSADADSAAREHAQQADTAAGDSPPQAAEPITAGTIVAEWIERCPHRPPTRTIGQTSNEIKKLLDEGIHPDHIRAGMGAWMAKGYGPGAIHHFVNSAMNARSSGPPRGGARSPVPDHNQPKQGIIL